MVKKCLLFYFNDLNIFVVKYKKVVSETTLRILFSTLDYKSHEFFTLFYVCCILYKHSNIHSFVIATFCYFFLQKVKKFHEVRIIFFFKLKKNFFCGETVNIGTNYLSGNQPCQLVCGSATAAYYFGPVKDGTKCVPGSRSNDICIKGECQVRRCPIFAW